MKKIKITQFLRFNYLLAFVVIISISSFGCSKKQVVYNSTDVTKLNENKAYIKLTLETNSFLQYLSETAKAKSLYLPDVIKRLNTIRYKNLSFDDQMREIDKIFTTDVSTRLFTHMTTYSETWPEINKNYTNISKEILESEATEVLNDNRQLGLQLQIKSYSTNNIKVSLVADCGWRYSLCVGAATAGAILCHAGCETTALATTAGLGIPLCVAACGTIQAYAGMECFDNYCN